ncbi:MAG: ROK family protein [Clostridia bacterium]|nr:ROK family protein [Clostridia bacterium]
MASAKQFIERRDNVASIISFTRQVGRATRMKISSALSLSWACVSDLVAGLIEDRVLIESASGAGQTESRGRTPIYLALNDEKYFLGVDINDSGIAVSVLGMSGRLLNSKKWEPEVFETTDALTKSVIDKIQQMLTSVEDCCGIGVAMEGVHSDDGWCYPIGSDYVEYNPYTVIKSHFDLPVFARHDPECMLYALGDEAFDDCMLLRIDNEIGSAVMKRGEILDFPLELGRVRYGKKKLRHLFKAYFGEGKMGDGAEFGEALGCSVGNLMSMLGLYRVFVVGEIVDWFDGISNDFDTALKSVGADFSYEVRRIMDASEGAARLAMSKYPILK